MAFRRSPVRSRSGPPSFARALRELRMASQPPTRGRSPSPASAKPPAKDGVHRSGVSVRSKPRRRTVRIARPGRCSSSYRNQRASLHQLRAVSRQLPLTVSPTASVDVTRFLSGFSRTNVAQALGVVAPKRFVYILRSRSDRNVYYTGVTSNVRRRLSEHNAGQCSHTGRNRPWELDLVIAFRDEARALTFERYLKSGSGCAFAARHFR